jgi:hypothetical protein
LRHVVYGQVSSAASRQQELYPDAVSDNAYAVGQGQAKVAGHAAQREIGGVAHLGAGHAVGVTLDRHTDEHRYDGREHPDHNDHEDRLYQGKATFSSRHLLH